MGFFEEGIFITLIVLFKLFYCVIDKFIAKIYYILFFKLFKF